MATGKPKILDAKSNAKILVPINDSLFMGIDRDRRLLIPYTLEGKIGFINRRREVVVEPKYAMYYGDCYEMGDYIKVEDFNHSFGILNYRGKEILPLGYDGIQDASQDGYDGIIAIKGEKEEKIPLYVLLYASMHSLPVEEAFDKWAEEYYKDMKANMDQEAWEHYQEYGEYEGSYAQDVMGYSDGEIGDAFDGDPDAYWNID